MDSGDTIAAIASAPGSGARGIIRISGADAVTAASRVLAEIEPGSKRACRVRGLIRLPNFPEFAADAWVWPTVRSYTGEPMVELHLPGSPPVLELTLDSVFRAGVRPARAGEFTLRAFLAGRMDLAQAEAVLGVIDADDHEELATALKQLAGGLSGKLQHLREDLLLILADLEAGLDFVDEDIEFISTEDVIHRLTETSAIIRALEQQAEGRSLSSSQLRVVLAGLPNAGKSTLFNALAGSDEALVSDVVGTTRDYLAAPISFEGLSVELVDTAGWEDGRGGIEGVAQQLRSEQVQEADLLLWCSALDTTSESQDYDDVLFREAQTESSRVIRVGTRSDLADGRAVTAQGAGVSVSAISGSGLLELRKLIQETLCESRRGERQFVGSTAARSLDSLRRSRESLDQAINTAKSQAGHEFVAMEIRLAIESLGEIIGKVYTDDLLDRIFSRFCIGK